MVEITEASNTEDLKQRLYQSTATPYPAWILSGLLFATPVVTSQPQAVQIHNAQEGGGSLFRAARRVHIGPTTISSVLFGGAMALGGWIMHEGDIESGSGFITAWSSLYLVVNGRQAFNGIRYGRFWPVMLSGVALGEALLHGKRFFYSVEP